MTPSLLIRADGSAVIGAGHVMRCLALAQAWQLSGGRAVFLQAETTPALGQRLRQAGCETRTLSASAGSATDAAETIREAQACGAAWIVGDGYHLDTAWQQQIRNAGLRLLLLDDYGHASHYHADIVLNQNLSADAALYAHRDASTRLLLGPRYALLRREFLAAAHAPRDFSAPARRVLVTLGGSDPDNVTAQVLAAVRLLPDLEVRVVIGGSNPHRAALLAAAAANPAVRCEVDATDMPGLMAWADVAITAGGSTSWELACAGLPALQLVLAPNQAGIAAALERAGATINLGDFRTVAAETIAARLAALCADSARRAAMSASAARLVDGHGARRVAAALGTPLQLTLVSDAGSWLNDFLPQLRSGFEADGHAVRWIHDPAELADGDIAFLLSLGRIVPPPLLRRHAHNLVVHESALPHGRGWSPLTWQILEGRSEIPVTLFEAAAGLDSGDIYAQQTLRFAGHELIVELRAAQAAATLALCREFVARYPFICNEGRAQTGEPTTYPRRRPADSQLDPDKTLREQFNLLRVCDPARYPAFVELQGRRFHVHLTPATS